MEITYMGKCINDGKCVKNGNEIWKFAYGEFDFANICIDKRIMKKFILGMKHGHPVEVYAYHYRHCYRHRISVVKNIYTHMTFEPNYPRIEPIMGFKKKITDQQRKEICKECSKLYA